MIKELVATFRHNADRLQDARIVMSVNYFLESSKLCQKAPDYHHTFQLVVNQTEGIRLVQNGALQSCLVF